MAGPVLEDSLMYPDTSHLLAARLIDAREAALCLNLPLYWLTHAKERQRLGLPHYRVGKLVRFKLHELVAWAEAQQPQDAASTGAEVADAGLQ